MDREQGIKTAKPIPESTVSTTVVHQTAVCANCAGWIRRQGDGPWVHAARNSEECGVGAKLQQLRKDAGR